MNNIICKISVTKQEPQLVFRKVFGSYNVLFLNLQLTEGMPGFL